MLSFVSLVCNEQKKWFNENRQIFLYVRSSYRNIRFLVSRKRSLTKRTDIGRSANAANATLYIALEVSRFHCCRLCCRCNMKRHSMKSYRIESNFSTSFLAKNGILLAKLKINQRRWHCDKLSYAIRHTAAKSACIHLSFGRSTRAHEALCCWQCAMTKMKRETHRQLQEIDKIPKQKPKCNATQFSIRWYTWCTSLHWGGAYKANGSGTAVRNTITINQLPCDMYAQSNTVGKCMRERCCCCARRWRGACEHLA